MKDYPKKKKPKPWICMGDVDENRFMCPDCESEFYFEYDGPVENGYNFCPSCGKQRIDYEREG